jgi:opacity protein-like surface antigen
MLRVNVVGQPAAGIVESDMVRVFRTFLAAGVMLAGVGAASAADLDAPIFVENAPELVPVEIGNGWYLRGDVGFAVTKSAGPFSYRTFNPVTGLYSDNAFATSNLTQERAMGIGVGYQFNQWLRGDITLDRFSGDFTGSTVSAGPCIPTDPTLVGTSCRTTDTQSYTAYSGMVNAYADLGTFLHVTPYVGAGVGYTMMNYGALTNNLICVPGVGNCPPTNPVLSVTHTGVDEARFTYSLMAGASYDLSKSLKFDLGYKYTKIDSGGAFNFDQASQNAGAQGIQGTDKGLERHDVRVGLRYSLW